MSRLILIAVFVGGILYLYRRGAEQAALPPELPPRPPALDAMPAPVLSEEELEKVRLATKDTEPNVRWAAIELLYRVHDPQAYAILENTLSIDTELSVRKRALDVIKQSDDPSKAKDLALALKDSEKEIRMAALLALGETGEASVAPNIVELLKDVEPDVRLQAIHALGRIQERRYQEFKVAQDKLREEYERAVRRSQGRPDQTGGLFHQFDDQMRQLDASGKGKKGSR